MMACTHQKMGAALTWRRSRRSSAHHAPTCDAMSDQSGYTPFTPYPESPRPPSEPVCTMRKDTVGCRIELRDDERVNAGVELQLFRNDEFLRGRRFRDACPGDGRSGRVAQVVHGEWLDPSRRDDERRHVMDATGKLRGLARRFTAHQRECHSALGIALTPLDVYASLCSSPLLVSGSTSGCSGTL